MSRKFSISVFIVFLALLVVNATLLVRYVKAAGPVPGFHVPCDAEDNPEFNSLRPYQASPCGDSVKAYFCGNEIQVVETIKKTVDGHVDSINPNVNVVDKPYDIDLADTEFPILGNTEDVQNSQNGEDLIDDATKVNEYVSWYLNGVNNKAEYGDEKNTDEAIVNFSGPIQKLLPGSIQDYQRIQTIAQATQEITFTDADSVTSGSGDTAQEITEPQNHNQIVACASKQVFGINNAFIGKTVAHECYPGNDSNAGGVYRLKDWDVGEISLFNKVLNWAGGNVWNKKYPPLPWQFEDPILYDKAYNEWRGKTCSILPFVNKVVCIDNPLVTNEWSDLFKYVPLANTVDKNAKMLILTVTFKTSAGVSMPEHSWVGIEEPTHFYPHTQEVRDLSALLNKTYIPQGITGSIPTQTTENNGKCSILNVRANEGEELFPIKQPADIRITGSYKVDEIPCKHGFYKDGRPKSDCEGEVYIGIQTNPVKVPYANEIWKSTVADSTSTFRKIYPKVEEGAPISCVADIPSVTDAVYTPLRGEKINVIGPLHSPDEHKMDPESAKIYFPHIGSVYEYFLKGIQTALRPQGFGDPITDGTACSNLKCGELPKGLPKASGSCAVGGISSKVGDIPESLKKIVEASAETYKVPPSLILGVMYGEGAFNREPFRRYDWTEQNVNNWATCQPLTNCSGPESSVIPFFEPYWEKLAKEIEPDLKKIDPNRAPPDPCNLLDVVYAVGKDLSTNQFGSDAFAGKTCFGMDLNTPSSSKSSGTCSWEPKNIQTAIRVWEFGTEYSLPNACATKPGSCATGGGFDAACPNGDNCERYTGAGNTSHNACVWDVTHGN